MFNFFKSKNPVNRKQQLISGLKTAINALENDVIHYSWTDQSSCNCGVVVQALTGYNRNVIGKMITAMVTAITSTYPNKKKDIGNPTWQNMAKYYCSITGESTQKIFIELKNKGLTNEDIVHLEYMNNAAILKESQIKIDDKNFHANKENLILYLKAWVRILEGKTQQQKPEIENKESLSADLLIAVAEEKYEHAARIRDKIAELV